jgi:hypothetical protein
MQDGKGPGRRVLVSSFSDEGIKADSASLQELIISSIYVYQTWQLFKGSFNPMSRSILNQLLAVNLIVILLDMSLLVLQLVNLHELQVSLKPAIYSFKLKLEFAVLGQLICLVGGPGNDRSRKSSTFVPFVTEKSDRSGTSNNISDFVDVEKIAGNLQRPSGTMAVHGSMSDTDLIMAMPRTSNAT